MPLEVGGRLGEWVQTQRSIRKGREKYGSLTLQQIEGNLIYPRVVGSSVGLPPIWVLTAVTLGGSLWGIVGMLFAVPTCSVVYALTRMFVRERLAERRVPETPDAPRA